MQGMNNKALNTVLLLLTTAGVLFLAFSEYQIRQGAEVVARKSELEQERDLYLSCAATDSSDHDKITPYRGYLRFDGKTLYLLKGAGDGEWEPMETDVGGAVVTGTGQIVWSGEVSERVAIGGDQEESDSPGYVNASLKLDRFTLEYTVLGEFKNDGFPGYPVYGDGRCEVVNYKVGL